MLAKFRTTIAYPVFTTFLLGILLAGCSASMSQQTAAPSTQTQQTGDTTQSASAPGPNQDNMEKVIARAATTLDISESDLSNAFNQAITSVRSSQSGGTQSPGNNPHRQRLPQGQKPAQGQQAPSGPSDMMKRVYSKIAATLNLNADNVTAAFQQAQSELKQ